MRQFKPGQLQTGSLYNISASYAVTSSYSMNGGGTSIDTGSLVTTSSLHRTQPGHLRDRSQEHLMVLQVGLAMP